MAVDPDQGPAADMPDLMNDPAYAVNTPHVLKRFASDPDTCRICRGEGTDAEPLFYPCRCSGSIKFVHQECLMEWLSHSQKKYCELCKTPFRFTKLYHPHMPSSLPVTVFLRHVTTYIFANLVSWSRFLLVCFVWLAWLPWSMRAVWRFLFWLADGGWSSWQRADEDNAWLSPGSSAVAAIDRGTSATSTPAVLPSAVLSAQQSVCTSSIIPSFMAPVSQTLNMTAGEPTILQTLNAFLATWGIDHLLTSNPSNETIGRDLARSPHPAFTPSTFFSDVSFLNNATRSPRLNKIIIDTIEGQLITLLVVVAFILIFLIREWVVQQQPGIHMDGDFNGDVLAPPGQAPVPPEPTAEAEPTPTDREPTLRHDLPPPPDTQDALRASSDALGAGADGDVPLQDPEIADPARRGRARPMARARRRVHFAPEIEVPPDVTTQARSVAEGPGADDLARAEAASELEQESEPALQRPTLPPRDALARAAEIRRRIEEDRRQHGREGPMEVFMNIWQRANRNPSEVIRMIEDEHRTEELGWVLEVMKRRVGTGASLSTAAAAPFMPASVDPVVSNVAEDSSTGRKDHIGADGEALHALPQDDPMVAAALPSQLESEGEVGKSNPVSGSSPIPPGAATGPYVREKGKAKLFDGSWTSHDCRPDFSGAAEPCDAEQCTTDEENIEPETKKPKHSPTAATSLATLVNSSNSVSELSSDSDAASSAASTTNPFRLDHQEHEDVHHAADGSDALPEVPSAANGDGDGDGDNEQFAHRIPPAPPAPQGLVDRVIEWLWGDVVPDQRPRRRDEGIDEHVVDELAAEPPFVPIAHHRDDGGEADEPEDADAAAADDFDALDQDAVEDGEDFDGVMELIGMRGPLSGLFQNATFSALLISATVAGAIWFPYIWGKVVLVVLVHPWALFVELPFRIISTAADLLADLTLFLLGSFVHWADRILRFALLSLAVPVPLVARYAQSTTLAAMSRSVAERGLERISKIIVALSLRVSSSEHAVFSIVSHQALETLKQGCARTLTQLSAMTATVYADGPTRNGPSIAATWATLCHGLAWAQLLFSHLCRDVMAATTAFARPNAVRDLLDVPAAPKPMDTALAQWSTGDRVIAVVAGYAFFALLGALYLRKGRPFSTSEQGKKVEDVVADVLQQAGGVLKVILIISIEMIAFPLYCGLLLDLALLPLFEEATVASRVHFTFHSPCTSLFVHWFVGTCYMFHFALFVAMCRRIVRGGVLYFIRDPDDPTFHPVRDVLERNVVTQLRKITFSALVYGALVIICLGGVVWGLAYSFDGVLPVHWSSNEPVLEFPVDLLFYNFLMPLAVRFFKPSDGLHAMYTWWFRKCARALRLSWFLFGERAREEEGHHVRRTWWGVLVGKRGDPWAPVIGNDRKVLAEDRQLEAYFLRDGRYVRTPASDQVRIPKGESVFLEVDEKGRPVEGEERYGQHQQHPELFAKVYIPPWFNVRIGLFILLIWLFAAVTGVGVTIVPLVFGRMVFATLIPPHLRMNDVYAFSIGIYLLGGALHAALRYDRAVSWIRQRVPHEAAAPGSAFRQSYVVAVRVARLSYTYAAFGVVLPALFALLMEAYVIIPVHTLLAAEEKHIIHFIQDWTLGVLYLKIVGRLILWHTHSRPAEALRAVTRRGWTNPDVHVATRCFILPACVVMVSALLAPIPLGWLVNTFYFAEAEATVQRQVYRYSYPAMLGVCVGTGLVCLVAVMFRRWRCTIRDEVYLIGERLHNLGERRPTMAQAGK